MPFVAAKCPQCGGALQVPDDRDMVTCMYCKFDIRVREAVRLVGPETKNLLALAEAAAAASNNAEAYGYFNRVLEAEPANVEAWLGKGTAAGWQSTLVDFRFAEMLVAFENAVKHSPPEKAETVKKLCAGTLNDVGVACYSMANKHMHEFIALPNTWVEYLPRCRQIISLQEHAHSYDPTNRVYIENVIHLCKDNVEGVSYRDPYDNNISKAVFLSSDYENEIRALLKTYAEKLRAIDPSYVPPNPQKASAGCFVVTATMGNEDHPAVRLLRKFRDEVLLRSDSGKQAVAHYYRFGPLIADIIRPSRLLRFASLLLLVLPATGIAYLGLWLETKLNHRQ